MKNEVWFTDQERHEMTVPTLNKVAAMLEKADYELAAKLCKGLKAEWGFLRILMIDSIVELLDYIEDKKGKEYKDKAGKKVFDKLWKTPAKGTMDSERQLVEKGIIEDWAKIGVNVESRFIVSWLSKEYLNQMTYPKEEQKLFEYVTERDKKRAIESIKIAKHEWGIYHDLLVESIALLLTFISEECGEQDVGYALAEMTSKVWKEPFLQIQKRDQKTIAIALAATWRAHSTYGAGPDPGSFEIYEDEDKLTFKLGPCGSGQRLWRMEHENYGKTKGAYSWSFNRKDFPYYCAHCTYMNELMPINWSGNPVYPLDPPTTPDKYCTWYFYKDPEGADKRFYERYGIEKDKVSRGKDHV